MRKQTKLVAVLSAAALLAIGASMTSFAATGWTEENGTWVYYDKDGSRVTDKWEKSGNNWFYLNSDGEMSSDVLVDDDGNYYYVGSDGAMVANQWVAIANENAGDEFEPDSYWYYFQSNGKAYKAGSTSSTSFKTINGKKYAFDTEGKMLYGWVNKNASRETGDTAWTNGTYFCGDENDGAQATGWAQIDVVDANEDDEDQTYWFYFNTANGQKYADAKKTINGKKYQFTVEGKMESEWASSPSTAASVSSYSYYSAPEEGWRAKGWFKAVPAKEVDPDAYNDDSQKWFYSNGDGTIVSSQLKTITNKKYAFDEKGEMLSGVVALNLDAAGSKIVGGKNGYLKIDDSVDRDTVKDAKYDLWKVFYFGGSDDGSMKTGNQNVTIDGDSYSYVFGTTGSTKGVGKDTTQKSSPDKDSIYVRGEKIKADSDYRYQAIDLKGNKYAASDVTVDSGKYLVNTSGTVMKSRTNVKDADGVYYCTDKNGIITYVNTNDTPKK